MSNPVFRILRVPSIENSARGARASEVRLVQAPSEAKALAKFSFMIPGASDNKVISKGVTGAWNLETPDAHYVAEIVINEP